MVDIRPGCEPWFCEGSGPNAETGILIVHGFTGSPAGMRPLAEDLAERGFTVELPLLPGHGTQFKNLMKVRWQDLARETVAAFERLRSRTSTQIAVGLSVGALIALRLAQTRNEELAGVVAINPFLGTDAPLWKLLPVLRWVLPSYKGVINDIAKPGMDEIGYDRLPVKGLHSISNLQRDVKRDLPAMRTPTLLLTSREDHAIGGYSARLLPAAIGSDDFEHVWLERSYHVATLDYDYPLILDSTAKFAERVGRA